MQMAEKKKKHLCTSNRGSSLNRSRQTKGPTTTQQDVLIFECSQVCTWNEQSSTVQAPEMWESPETILRNCKSFSFQRRLTRILLDDCMDDLANNNRNRKSERGGSRTASCFMPASRVVKKRGGNEKTEAEGQCQAEKTGIVEQVTRWQDSKTGLKGDHPYLEEDHST